MTTGKTCAQVLADFVYDTEYEDLPEEAITMSRAMLLDQLGGQLACSALDWNKKVFQYVQDLEIASDQSTIVGYGVRSAAEYAGFANATFGHGFEIDDFNPVASAHPGCVAVPASLAVGEREQRSGKDLLTGVALASEVITRVGQSGMKYMLARGFHETCILGVFGASAVAGKMLGMGPKEIAYAMSIAGSHASGTTEFSLSGGDVKRVHAGLGANGGIRSARLAQLGLTGPLTILEGKHGVLKSFGGRFAETKLTDKLGEDYIFLSNGFKPYCCAIDIQSPIDSLARILGAESLEASEIAEIVVPVTKMVMWHAGSIGPEPHDITGAQMSMHFSLGLTAVKRSNDFGTYMEAWEAGFQDPAVLGVAKKVSLMEAPGSDDPENAELIPKGELTVKTSSGKTYSEQLLPSKGSPENPMTHQELEDKFMSLATKVMPTEQASKIAATVSDLENVEHLGELTDLLVSSSLVEAVH